MDQEEKVHKLVENPSRTDITPIVKAVKESNIKRYELLCAWERNWDMDTNFRERLIQNIEDC